MQKTHKIRPKTRLALKQQTVRMLSSQQLTLVAGGETTGSNIECSISDCPFCEER
ncbi:MAG TPA: hypothetical protein VHW23_19910 [Kofleriaceae bacterium]|jgi:hypothetical protein|nr:hypothetical protein [Kofleriaceae bacterium]